jgi:hypothetical protein
MKMLVINNSAVNNGGFDINNQVLIEVDKKEKLVIAHILCEREEFVSKFHQTVHSIAKQFSGYEVKAVLPLEFGLFLNMTARIH